MESGTKTITLMSCKALTKLITLYSHNRQGYPSGCCEESALFARKRAGKTQGPEVRGGECVWGLFVLK